MAAPSKGRPKKQRQFKFFAKEGDFGLWMENVNYKPGVVAKNQPAPEWVNASIEPTGDEKGCGKPLPSGTSWDELPDPSKFLREWKKATRFEDVVEKYWYVSPGKLRKYRSTINAYLEGKGFRKIPTLRSQRHLFGGTGAQADRAIKRLIADGIIEYVSAAERNAATHGR